MPGRRGSQSRIHPGQPSAARSCRDEARHHRGLSESLRWVRETAVEAEGVGWARRIGPGRACPRPSFGAPSRFEGCGSVWKQPFPLSGHPGAQNPGACADRRLEGAWRPTEGARVAILGRFAPDRTCGSARGGWRMGSPEGEALFRSVYDRHRTDVLAYFLRRLDPETRSRRRPILFLVVWRRIAALPRPRVEALAVRCGPQRAAEPPTLGSAPGPWWQGGLRSCGSPPQPDTVVVGRAEGDALLAALDRLPRADAEVLRLRQWEELSFEDVRRCLGVLPACRGAEIREGAAAAAQRLWTIRTCSGRLDQTGSVETGAHPVIRDRKRACAAGGGHADGQPRAAACGSADSPASLAVARLVSLRRHAMRPDRASSESRRRWRGPAIAVGALAAALAVATPLCSCPQRGRLTRMTVPTVVTTTTPAPQSPSQRPDDHSGPDDHVSSDG